MDWKVAARTDRYFIKKFEDETNLPCHILIDQSRSMAYGSTASHWSKATYAATVAATLATFLLKQGDAVGITTFGQHLLDHLPAGNKAGQLKHLLAMLERQPHSMGTSLATSLDQISSLARRRGLMVLVSDLLAPVQHLQQQLSWITSRRHQLVVLHVVDPTEMDFSFGQALHFVDAESGQEKFVQPEQQRAAYLTRHTAHLTAVQAACDAAGARRILCRSDSSIADTLVKLIMG